MRSGPPCDANVVKDGALDRGEPDGKEPQRQGTRERESQLNVPDRDAGSDQLVQRRAPGAPGRTDAEHRVRVTDLRDALVVDQRHRRVAAHQFGVAQEHGKLIRIAPEPPVEHRAHGEGERTGEQVLSEVGEAAHELPPADRGRACSSVGGGTFGSCLKPSRLRIQTRKPTRPSSPSPRLALRRPAPT